MWRRQHSLCACLPAARLQGRRAYDDALRGGAITEEVPDEFVPGGRPPICVDPCCSCLSSAESKCCAADHTSTHTQLFSGLRPLPASMLVQPGGPSPLLFASQP